jgi:hypothetical protein
MYINSGAIYVQGELDLSFRLSSIHANYNLHILMSSNQPSLFWHPKVFDIADKFQNKTITNTNIDKQAIKLWNMLYLLFKHFDPFLNLFPSLFVPSIKKKAAIVKCLSIC